MCQSLGPWWDFYDVSMQIFCQILSGFVCLVGFLVGWLVGWCFFFKVVFPSAVFIPRIG